MYIIDTLCCLSDQQDTLKDFLRNYGTKHPRGNCKGKNSL